MNSQSFLCIHTRFQVFGSGPLSVFSLAAGCGCMSMYMWLSDLYSSGTPVDYKELMGLQCISLHVLPFLYTNLCVYANDAA